MASRLNKKLARYCFRMKDPVAVDALSVPWDFRLAYLFPPLPLLLSVLKRIKREQVVVILVAPDWPCRAFFSDLRLMLADKL